MKFVNTAMWVWTAYNLINTYMAKEETVAISTSCSPWVAPVPTSTGDICEACNPDEYIKEGAAGKTYTKLNALLKCSEYKCKSYGAACGIVNEGTDKQKCVNLNPHDTRSPLIDYWKDGTGKEADSLKSNEIPRVGVEFLKGEISAYQRVTIGIKTDEPSQCKMSFKNGIKLEQMEPFFFGDATYEYFHTTILTYPKDVNSSGGLKFGEPGQIYQLYIRCQDALGNPNEKDYIIKFKISKGPDITPPTIETTTLGILPSERYLSVGSISTEINLFLNEAASCKWSNYDTDYDSMPADNECVALNSNMNDGLYECKFMEQGKESSTIGEPLKGFNDTELKYYYFRCKDQPACVNGKTLEGKDCTRNINSQSSVLTLRKSYLLNLSEINPGGDIYIGGVGGNITLEVRTQNGAEKTGKAFCGFTTTESQKNNVWGMNAFFNTNSSYHSQILSQLSTGSHIYYIGCADVAGNTVYGQTAFNLALDTEGPGIARAFIDSSSGTDIFKIRTNEKANCEYSITGAFNYGEGNAMLTDDETTHSAQGGANTYYVICEDQYNNRGSMITINFLL